MTGLFHAYVKNIGNNETWRYLITFASREVGDEWWRAVTTSSNAKLADSVKRISPQFYTHDPDRAFDISNSINGNHLPAEFRSKVSFTLLDDGLSGRRTMSIIPEQKITDHVSWNSFFIRSKAAPQEYWYSPKTSSRLYASRTQRTRFRVHIVDEAPNGTIMIGSDVISITLTSSEAARVGVSDDGGLMIGDGLEQGIKFSDFKTGFIAGEMVILQLPHGREAVKKISKTYDGEEWELV